MQDKKNPQETKKDQPKAQTGFQPPRGTTKPGTPTGKPGQTPPKR